MAAPVLLRAFPGSGVPPPASPAVTSITPAPQARTPQWTQRASVLSMFPQRPAPPLPCPLPPLPPPCSRLPNPMSPFIFQDPAVDGWRERQLPWPSGHAVPAADRAAWFELPTFQKHLDEITHSQALSGNCARLLVDGKASFAQKERALRGADVAFLKMYQFDNDDAGRAMAQELEHTARCGGRVFVQYGIKSFYSPWQLALIKLHLKKDPTPPVLQNLAGAPNVVLVPNDRPTAWTKLLFERDHEKYLITWRYGEAVKLIMGGMNISDAWLHGGEPGAKTADSIQYRDTDVEIVGPTAEDAITAFIRDMAVYDIETHEAILKTWRDMNKTGQNTLYPPSAENAVVRFVRNKPHHGEKGQYIKLLYLALLENVPAGETIRIANAYLLPRRDIRRALVAAADRGVNVELVINSTESPEWEACLLARAAHSFFRTMLRKTKCPEKFTFYEFTGNPLSGHNAMHQKIACFGDHGPCIVGSSNLDEQSLKYNREVVALIYGGQFRQSFDAMWQRDVCNGLTGPDGQPIVTTRVLTHQSLQTEPPMERLKQHALYRWGVGVL